MLSKVSSVWYVDTPDPLAVLRADPDPDPAAAYALARQLHPDLEVEPTVARTLGDVEGPESDELYIGCFPGLTLLCSSYAARVQPTAIPDLLVRPLAEEHTYLVAFDLEYGWGSFAHWERGELRRAFSSTRLNILQDQGLPHPWERPHWAGEHPILWRVGELADPLVLPFDPPGFADTANREWVGFQYFPEAVAAASDTAELDGFGEETRPITPKDIRVCGFRLYPSGHADEDSAPPPPPNRVAHERKGLLSWLRGHDTTALSAEL
ncbi:DUF6928 family protein [Nocardia sp. NBC_00416]|uniref:DUF6928 family protein n=1 Tax=Nocardia sp. NBC_00416 TaxID=2975991 RepID=UPI002E1AC1F7